MQAQSGTMPRTKLPIPFPVLGNYARTLFVGTRGGSAAVTTHPFPVAQGSDRSTNLTRRQRQVLRLQAYGLTYQEISERLGLSVWTIKNHHKQAIRALHMALGGNSRQPIRTSLACYILGLIDGGLSPEEIAKHLRQVQKQAREDGMSDGSEEAVPSLDETYAA